MADASPAHADRHFSCALTAVAIGRVRDVAGDAALPRLLELAGSDRGLAYLVDTGNWISYDEAVALWEAGAVVTGDPGFARHVGADFVSRLAGSGNTTVLRALGSPEELLRKIALAGHRFSTSADLHAVEVRPGYAAIDSTICEGFTRHKLHCEWTGGLLSQATALFGMPPATVDEVTCQVDGADACRFHITWTTGPEQQPEPGDEAAALREQLAGMSARLQSVFDTAADLIGSGDLEGTLARITDRAALQVRAPQFLLAVRTAGDGAVQCHQRGFGDAEADEAAARILDSGDDALPGHWLKVDVRSIHHHYGALLAVQKPGGSFFPHECELLEVYARYAATALDTATALAEAHARHQEAQRRYEESRTLLDLARRLAVAGSSDQVARRLADAVPGVVDCDRVGVYLWEDDAHQLVRLAVNETGDRPEDEGGLRTVRPQDIAQLASWVETPDGEPVFIDLDTSAVQQPLRDLGAVAAVAVPINTETRFLGCFIVSVRDRPERLAWTPELVDRLSGVAAHAVSALENGRLVDHITHQANHDQLTGAANRIGFHSRLEAATLRAREASRAMALFYIDLDDFKPINDTYGHGVGDDVLRAVATRLEACVRSSDTVARLGGDEFAVLVDLADECHLHAVARRLGGAFERPFEVAGHTFAIHASIGRADWPSDADGADDLLRRADAAMYAVKHGPERRAGARA